MCSRKKVLWRGRGRWRRRRREEREGRVREGKKGPDPAGGAYVQRSPDPLAGFKEPYF